MPLAMAFAIASGVGPERGLYTAVVAGFLISLLGGSRVQIGGPTGAFVVIVSGIVAAHGYSGLVVCTLMAGVLLVIMGLARLGGVIKFIPFPVVTGFTAGIAVVIFSTQMRDFFGLQMPKVPAEFVVQWSAYFAAFRSVNPAAACIGVGTVVCIVMMRRWLPRIPAMLVAMVLAAVAAAAFGLPVETIGSRFGDLPRGLPSPTFPELSLAKIKELASPAMTVALLAAIESLLSATVADGMMGTRHKSNMELVAQGVANIGSAVFGGIPATGAIARTATNIKSGARTPVAGMIHAATLLLVLVFMSPLARLVPMACLAGILVVVSWQMSQVEHIRQMLTAPKSDVVVLSTTFLLTVFVDLTVAVQVGVVLAAMLFIRNMAEVTNVSSIRRELRDEEDLYDPSFSPALQTETAALGIEVYEIAGPFFFGAAEKFKDTLRFVGRPPKAIILRMRNVPAMDGTALHVMRELLENCRRDGTVLMLAEVHARPVVVLQRSGLWEVIGQESIFGSLDEAIAAAKARGNP